MKHITTKQTLNISFKLFIVLLMVSTLTESSIEGNTAWAIIFLVLLLINTIGLVDSIRTIINERDNG